MSKTKACPACGHQLQLPDEYFSALSELKKQVEAFREVMIADFKFNNNEGQIFCTCDIAVADKTGPKCDRCEKYNRIWTGDTQ